MELGVGLEAVQYLLDLDEQLATMVCIQAHMVQVAEDAPVRKMTNLPYQLGCVILSNGAFSQLNVLIRQVGCIADLAKVDVVNLAKDLLASMAAVRVFILPFVAVVALPGLLP